MNGPERQKQARKKSPAVSAASMAMYGGGLGENFNKKVLEVNLESILHTKKKKKKEKKKERKSAS